MQPYTQTTEYTTAACSLMLIMHHLDEKFSLTRAHEFDIWRESVNLPTRAPSIFGLAHYAKKHGLTPTVVVESLEYDYPDYRFKRYTKSDVDLAQFASKQHMKAAEEANVPINERAITFEEIQELVKGNHILLIRLNEGIFRSIGSTSKYVVIYGFENNVYLVADPILDNPLITLDEGTLRESFETLATKKKRDHKIIVF